MRIKLLVVRGQPQGKNLVFPHGEFLIGRGSECHIRPNSDWVSRQHCLLRVTDDSAFIRDLGSTNGTLLNGLRIVGEQVLCAGDHLQVGPLVFEVRADDTPAVLESSPTPVPSGMLRSEQPASAYLPKTAEMPDLAGQLAVQPEKRRAETDPASPPGT